MFIGLWNVPRWKFILDHSIYVATSLMPVLASDVGLVLSVHGWEKVIKCTLREHGQRLTFRELAILGELELDVDVDSLNKDQLLQALASKVGDDDFVEEIKRRIEEKKKVPNDECDADDELAEAVLEMMDQDDLQEFAELKQKVTQKAKNQKIKQWKDWRAEAEDETCITYTTSGFSVCFCFTMCSVSIIDMMNQSQEKNKRKAKAKAKGKAKMKARAKLIKKHVKQKVKRRLSFSAEAVPSASAAAASSSRPELADASSLPSASAEPPSVVEPSLPPAEEPSAAPSVEPCLPPPVVVMPSLPLPSSAAELEPGVADVVPASQAPSEASDRRRGERGPNVHKTPGSLSDISPPGCSISLNCSLTESVSVFV